MVALSQLRGTASEPGPRRSEEEVETGPDPVRVLDDPARIRAALSPLRRRLLGELHEPQSASSLAERLGMPRQRLGYHLRVLEREGLVELVEERQRRGFRERLLRTTARALVVDPQVLERAGQDADEVRDRFSSAYLVATAARLVGDVAALREGAADEGKRLATLTLDTEVAFRSPREMKAFTEELTTRVADLVAAYHRPDDEASRPYRMVIGMHPRREAGEAPSSTTGEEP